MTETQRKGEPFEVSEKGSIVGQEYHYSPVPSNCMACATRVTSRKHKELEAEKSDTLCGPFPSSEDVCHSPEALAREKNRRARLHVVTTNRRIKVFGKWTKQKLLATVTDRLLQRATSAPRHSYEKIPPLEIKPNSAGVPYDPIIHRGIYSESVLRQLYCSGAPESVLIRAMKFGLRHLEPEQLNYFVQFGVSIPTLQSRQLWKDLIDETLVVALRTMGFDEKATRKIILNGMLAQNEVYLMQMMLAGVDVPGILNWQGPPIEVGVRMTQFLRKLGVAEDVLQLVVQKGVDVETSEMLKDLGYTETEEEEHPGMHEVVVCECDLTILESEVTSVNSRTHVTVSLRTLHSNLDHSKSDIEAGEICACFPSRSSSIRSSSTSSHPSLVTCADMKSTQSSLRDSEILLNRNDYLKRTVMAPLTWAMARALQYRPSDPKHYIACQLVRWRHGGVSKTEIKETEDFVTARTIEMDRILMEQNRKEEEELMAKREAEMLRNIPCHPCMERQQIHRIKERCWKCIKKWVPNYEPCELPEVCSSCKVNFSDILKSDSSTTSSANISSTVKVQKVVSEDRKRSLSTSQHSYAEDMELSRDYHMQEESFHSDSHQDNIAERVSDDSNKSVDFW